jgi:hypothetical protein
MQGRMLVVQVALAAEALAAHHPIVVELREL